MRFSSRVGDDRARAHHKVFLCVNTVDVAMLEALRNGKSLRADERTAVHFMTDAELAQDLRKLWQRYDLDTPPRVLDCPDRQLTRRQDRQGPSAGLPTQPPPSCPTKCAVPNPTNRSSF
jgi:hypothetical protein